MLLRNLLRSPSPAFFHPSLATPFRHLHILASLNAKIQLPPRPTVDEADISESFLKGSGPGGQKINKTSSAVQLKHHPSGLVIKCQATRSRSQNRKLARRLLAEKLEVREKGKESRVGVKEERERKKKKSAGKKARRKYRALGEVGDDEKDGAELKKVEKGEIGDEEEEEEEKEEEEEEEGSKEVDCKDMEAFKDGEKSSAG